MLRIEGQSYSRRYTLQASTFQMSVLLAFNEADSWTVAKLAEATQIKMDILIQVLNVFCVNLFCAIPLTDGPSVKGR